MSRVFVAEEIRLQRQVVVKVLSPDASQGISVERFEREIRTVAALQQANIVPVLTAGETNGLPFYTMPFVEGESLRAHLGRGPLPIADVVSILKDVARALGYAHSHGVVHRDIKPDNVLLSAGTAVVTDFGIAKASSASRTGGARATLTQVGTSIGTPAYMAPEQAAGDTQLDRRADFCSLGAMAWELLTGQHVFANRSPQRLRLRTTRSRTARCPPAAPAFRVAYGRHRRASNCSFSCSSRSKTSTRASRRGESLQARVIVPKTVLPEGNAMAVMLDPLGMPIVVCTAKR